MENLKNMKNMKKVKQFYENIIESNSKLYCSICSLVFFKKIVFRC